MFIQHNVPPKAFELICIGTKNSRYCTPVAFGQDMVLFSNYQPVAVLSGGVVYYVDMAHPAATMKAINALSPSAPHARIGPDDFDFALGSLLTRAGMALTFKPKKEEIPDGTDNA